MSPHLATDPGNPNAAQLETHVLILVKADPAKPTTRGFDVKDRDTCLFALSPNQFTGNTD